MKCVSGLILFFISFECCAPTSMVSQHDQTTGSNTTFNIQETLIPVNAHLNGFNTANLFHNYQDDSNGFELINGLNPKILRFPGGTVANFYHFSDPGYGYRASDLEKLSGNIKENATRSYNSEQKNLAAESIKENFRIKFVSLARELGAQVLIVANLLNEEDENILALIKYFKNEKIPIAGIELGNEYYFQAYRELFPDVESYIAKAKRISQKIRDFDERIPIGVIAANSAKLKGITGARKERFEGWNRKLGKENFYDAYIKHIYSQNPQCENNASLQVKMKCQLENNSNFIFESVSDSFKEFEEFYGNRPVWVTEWNVKDVFKNLGNTFLQGIYYADFMFFMMEEPRIEIATYHNLLAKGSGFNIIGQNPKRDWNVKGKYTKRAPYEVATLLNPLFANNYEKLISNSKKEHLLHSDVSMHVFKEKGTNKSLIYIINKSGTQVDLGDMEQIVSAHGSAISLKSVWSDALETGIGSNEWDESGIIQMDEKVLSSLRGNFIKGYSVNRLTIE